MGHRFRKNKSHWPTSSQLKSPRKGNLAAYYKTGWNDLKSMSVKSKELPKTDQAGIPGCPLHHMGDT
ncbi:unnamed protein product [Pieris macdunnoughi]|uniref:Uncharacterized protein n=1 Tax=Pieris macdunnoughi TaxID=345717 RepID=A0A821VIG8_9NEOP|nr:unnamed protein product [Pieris macdunnoughi]